MRIYNAMRAQIEMPLSNGTKLVIPGNSVSGEFMPNSTIISVFMSSYKKTDVAFIVSGPYEIAMLSNFAGSGEYVVSSLEEAVARFAPKEDPTTTSAPKVDEPKVKEEEVVLDSKKEEEIPATTEEPKKEEVAPAPVLEEKEEALKKKVVSPAPKKVEKKDSKPEA